MGLLCRAKRLLTRRLGVCSQLVIRKAEWSVSARRELGTRIRDKAKRICLRRAERRYRRRGGPAAVATTA